MPFVTEESWQRLPRRPNDLTPSIMVSSYPVNVCRYYLFDVPSIEIDFFRRTLRLFLMMRINSSILCQDRSVLGGLI